jgi:PAS domain S-box-containing protein
MSEIQTKKRFEITHSDIILESIACAVLTVDENMVITYFNRAAEKTTKVSRQDAIGKYCYDVLHSNICGKTCPLRGSYKTGDETIEKKKEILRSDGKLIPVSISTSPLRDESGKIIGGVETFRDLSTIEELRKIIRRQYSFEDIVSKNHLMLQVFDTLPIIARSESTVLIEGPSGSGKELLARAVHSLSSRAGGSFIAINCGALPETLLESELFGYVKGAFTDAKKDKSGRFALAKGGSIFLDEVESLPLSIQVKLLRVIQEREFEPLGAVAPVKADVRIIAATKENLIELVNKELFRDDLFYRLNVVKIELPPLKNRREDIPLLIDHFIEKFNIKMNKNIKQVSPDVMEVLMIYEYPGNIRELENIIEHAFVMCQGEEILLNHIPPEISNVKVERKVYKGIKQTLQSTERQTILETLEKYKWNKDLAAKELKLHRSTLWRKMRKYGLI